MDSLCFDCPRSCGAARSLDSGSGYCLSPSLPCVVRAAPHFGEEPCITGEHGSGAVFFSGCNLRCIFCQNHEISRASTGKQLTVPQLADVFLRLQDEGVHNINLVTGTHFIKPITLALEKAKLSIPVVWNSSAYEKAESLKMLDGLVQVYLPDYKYASSPLAAAFSGAADYPSAAAAAIDEMFRQRGKYIMDESGLLISGVLIRHLILPGHVDNSMSVIDWVSEHFPPNSVLFSLMSQYTPMFHFDSYPELNERIDAKTNRHLARYMERCGIENGYWQDISSSTDELLPEFNLTGVE
ncbi:MAG: radical SAM protein [Oscillospiraceae bacterium]|nr:radical SAM protein [Oscillospiraceae bacterium]